MAPVPGNVAHLAGRPDDWMVRKLRELEQAITAERTARSLGASSITAGGLVVKGGGSIEIDDGGSLLCSGDVAIEGTLSLPNGIIDNAALARPIEFEPIEHGVSGQNLASTMSTILATSIAVPAGFTSVGLVLNAQVGATASETMSSGVSCKVGAAGGYGAQISSGVVATFAISVPCSYSVTLEDVSGEIPITVQAQYFNGAPAAGTSNAHVSGLAIFTR